MVNWLLHLVDRFGGVVEAERGGRQFSQQVFLRQEPDWAALEVPAYRRRNLSHRSSQQRRPSPVIGVGVQIY